MSMFYKSVVESVLNFGLLISWYGGSSSMARGKMNRIITSATRLGWTAPRREEFSHDQMEKKCNHILSDCLCCGNKSAEGKEKIVKERKRQSVCMLVVQRRNKRDRGKVSGWACRHPLDCLHTELFVIFFTISKWFNWDYAIQMV